ncbi:MAG: hypothetical protein D6781_10225 [Verrucomicrobia bacterium]|nr:MAG: hypothetical protein D6781_10225 [Verrucomicrobiota bacterium]
MRLATPFAVLIALTLHLLSATGADTGGTRRSASETRRSKPPRTTVYSEVSKDYKREMLPTGVWKTETYAFAPGAILDREGSDPSLHELTFNEVGAIAARALASQQYVPATDPEKTDLLIVVHWGKTIPFDNGLQDRAIEDIGDILSAEMEQPDVGSGFSADEGAFESAMALQKLAQRERDAANRFNARLLGYAAELDDLGATPELVPPLRNYQEELVSDVETPRYFVILQAFDFQKAWKEKKMKLLWVTRMSIDARKRRFSDELAAMLAAAAESFGNNHGKLIRDARAPETEYGELEVLGIEK